MVCSSSFETATRSGTFFFSPYCRFPSPSPSIAPLHRCRTSVALMRILTSTSCRTSFSDPLPLLLPPPSPSQQINRDLTRLPPPLCMEFSLGTFRRRADLYVVFRCALTRFPPSFSLQSRSPPSSPSRPPPPPHPPLPLILDREQTNSPASPSVWRRT
jgi:hypothetical protein